MPSSSSVKSSKPISSKPTATVHVHGHWRHYDDGSKTYIAPATRHIEKAKK